MLFIAFFILPFFNPRLPQGGSDLRHHRQPYSPLWWNVVDFAKNKKVPR